MCFCTWFPLLLFELGMILYLYVHTCDRYAWLYKVDTKKQYEKILTATIYRLNSTKINIHNKDNLDKALLLISLGLPPKEIENLLGES